MNEPLTVREAPASYGVVPESQRVRPGYKQTEVGVIPEDWNVKLLPEVCRFRGGKAHEQYISKLGQYVCVNSKFISTEGKVRKHSTTNFCCANQNDVLMVMSDLPNGKALAKAFIADHGDLYAVNQRVCALTAYNDFPKFLFYILNRNPYFLRFDNGVSQTHLLNNVFTACQIPLPPTKAEQEAIAGALSDADGLIETLSQLIAKKRQIKQGAMQALLTGKKRLPGFSGEWEVKRLGDTGYFLKGCGVRKNESLSGDLPCIRYGEIYTKHCDYIKTFYSWVSPEVAATARRLKHGDLLFAGSGETKEEIGKCVAFVDDAEAYAGGDIVILRPENSSPTFLGYYLNTVPINRQKASRGQGDAVVHIGAAALSSMKIKIPKFDEQTAIAAILSAMDAEITVLETRLAKISKLKQGMMHNLLTGRIRLI